jgi:hypothetical protein
MVMSLTVKIPNCLTAPSLSGGSARHNVPGLESISKSKDLRCGAGHIRRTCPSRQIVLTDCDGPATFDEMSCVRMLWNLVVTAACGALAYGLAWALGQTAPWPLAIGIFTGGVVLIVAVLIDVDEHTKAATQLVSSANSANTLLTVAEGSLGGDSLSDLIEAASRLDRHQPGQLRFADRQVRRLTDLLEGLNAGQAQHRGDLDWRAGLTESALARIDIAGMVSGALIPGEDLDGALQAVKRGVRIRRVFLIDTRSQDDIEALLQPYRKVGVEIRVLRSDDFDFLLDGTLTEFALFDAQLSYEVREPAGLDAGLPPVTVIADEQRVAARQRRFEEIWDAAERV